MSEKLNAIQACINWAKSSTNIFRQGTADAAALELAHYEEITAAAREYLNETPESEIELAREVWGNTNTRCTLDKRAALAALLDRQP